MLRLCHSRMLRNGIRSHRMFSRTAAVQAPRFLAPSRVSSLSYRSFATPLLSRVQTRSFSSSWTPPASDANMTDHLSQAFEDSKAEGRTAFVAYTTVGYPDRAESVEIIKGLQDGGADVIELGVPFTDPLADGSTIQLCNQQALDNGTTSLEDVLAVAKQAREAGVTVPFVCMGYYNPFLHYKNQDLDKLFADCKSVGICGFIIVDLPPEESNEFRRACKKHKLSFIPLVAPTTTDERLAHLTTVADSFIYAVSLTGVTGARTEMSSTLPDFVKRIKGLTDLPVAVGFGIGNNKQFVDVGKMADGVVVGSALMNAVGAAPLGKRGDAARESALSIGGRSALTDHTRQTRDVTERAFTEDVQSEGMTFGNWGGRYVPETLVQALDELDSEYAKAKVDPKFAELCASYNSYIGRPTPLHFAPRLTEMMEGADIYLKREDLNHTGAHKINNAVSQCLLAMRLGKKRIIAETGAGQHGVACATVCAKFGLELVVYMGAEDVRRQALNVFRMEMLGAKVVAVDSGTKTLKDAINEAMRDWVTNIATTHYLVGSAIGPHPFPTIVRDFQSCIGRETREQMLKLTGKLPDAVVACVGGGSNAIGMFHPFIEDKSVRMIGAEAGGHGLDSTHSATLTGGTAGVLHGTRTYLLQNPSTGQITGTHSISAGLDYPGVGPEHAFLKDIHRAEYVAVTDREALMGFKHLTLKEGIVPALESSHAISAAMDEAAKMKKGESIVICVSGRGDKDIDTVRASLPKFGCKLNVRTSEDTGKVE